MMKPDTSILIKQPSTGVLNHVTALTLGLVMAIGLWQIVAATRHPDGLEFPRSWADFRAGRMTGGLEKQLDQKLPLRPTLIAAANSARYLLTGGAGEQVRVGQNNFLFLTDELKFEPHGELNLQSRAELLGAAARAFQAQHVQLVVALVPDKARVYAKFLPHGRYPGYNEPRYASAIAALKQRKVATVDLLAPFTAIQAQEVYYRTDTHWNQTGAQIAAESIALQIQAMNLNLEPSRFQSTASGVPTERAGDLIHLMGLDNVPDALRPPPDRELGLTTRQTDGDQAVGLFGDASLPVTLVGTSYSLRGNFHGFLQQALMSKVLNAAKDGGGLLDAATAYLKDDAFKQNKPKLVIWEIPERFLYAPLGQEQTWLDRVGFEP